MHVVPGPREGARAVVVVSLESTTPLDRNAIQAPAISVVVENVTADKAALSRELYTTVGADWHWVDRLTWTKEEWAAWTDRDEHHLLIATLAEEDGGVAGYAELEQQPAGAVEIAYFGLLPAFHGRGLGGHLLRRVLDIAWTLPGTERVWVHTCDLDSPAALANYRARGMREFRREIEWRISASNTDQQSRSAVTRT
jgi:GNAT superfamily N-acetyltransferase